MALQKLSPPEAKFQKLTGIKLGKVMYEGDGNVYPIRGQRGRLVKIVPSDRQGIQNAMEVLEYLYHSKSPAVVRLHQIGHFKAPYDYGNGRNMWYYYYYVMDKLKEMPRSGRHEKIIKIGSSIYNKSPLHPRTSPKLKSFIEAARQLKYSYGDVHEYNILQNKNGELKFIDLESFMF
jgi:hypothetical protein